MENATCATEVAGSVRTSNARTSEPNDTARRIREAIKVLFLVGLRLPGVAVNLRVARPRGYVDPTRVRRKFRETNCVLQLFANRRDASRQYPRIDIALHCMHAAHLKRCVKNSQEFWKQRKCVNFSCIGPSTGRDSSVCNAKYFRTESGNESSY